MTTKLIKVLRLFLCVGILFAFHLSPFTSVMAQGNGTASNPYQIGTKDQLLAFATCLGSGNQFYYDFASNTCVTAAPSSGSYDTIPAHAEGVYFKLTADIVVNEGNLAACDGVIDPSWIVWPETGVFKGYLRGDKHTIIGMYIDRPDTTVGVGFFSKMEGNAHVEKLGIVNSYVRGGASNIGGMVGELSGGYINDCFFEGSIRTSGDNVGGFVGLMTLHDTLLPEISVCFASGHLDCSGDYVAGLVGKVEKGTVRHCYSSMAVRTTDVVGTALSGANPTNGGIGTDEDIVNHHVGGIYGYALSPTGTNSYDPDVDSIRVDTCYFDWQLSDLPSIPGSSWVPADWRDNRGAAALSTYDMTYYSMMYFDIKNKKTSLWKNTYLCNVYPYPDPFNDPINVTYRLEMDYPQDSNVLATLIPFLDVFVKPNGNGQSSINNMNNQERRHLKLSNFTESFVLWKGCDSLGFAWTVDSLWPDAVRREFYAPDNSWNIYLQKQGVVRFTIEAAGRTRYYDAVINVPPYVGSAENPFLISSTEDFLAFRDGINSDTDFVYHRFLIPRDSLPHIHWLQTADIDLASAGNWTSVGKNADTCFVGYYDGGGHKIMNLTLNGGSERALFRYPNATIKNLVIEDPYVYNCGLNSATLATYVMGGTIENCGVTFSANPVQDYLHFGREGCAALVGYVGTPNSPIDTVVISNCFNSCDVHSFYALSTDNVAGLVGNINAAHPIIERCFNSGNITSENGSAYGITGGANCYQCFNSGNITASVNAAGICANTAIFSYNTGVITCTGSAHSVAGVSAQHSFNDYSVTGLSDETKIATRHFVGAASLALPVFGNEHWLYEEGRYPRLRWTDTCSWARDIAIAACTPVLPPASFPLPDTITITDLSALTLLRNGVNTNASFKYQGYMLPAYAQDIVFSLTSNIALPSSGTNSDWRPIGYTVPGSGDEGHFAGVFLGNEHTISNLQTSQQRPVAGLFGRLAGRVVNLIIDLGTLSATEYAGGVCAILDGGRVERCYVSGGVIESDYIAGGIVAVVQGADSIVSCANFASVTGNHSVGGLVGEGGHVIASANFGDVTGMPASIYTGGISGHGTTVEKSFNSGTVTARPGNHREDNWVGGLIGYSDTTILHCYNAGIVNGNNRKYTGGICGYGVPQYCYVSGTTRSTGTHRGSIVGASVTGVSHCCYDNQMSPIGGIDGNSVSGAEGLPTVDMLSNQLQNPNAPFYLGPSGSVWTYNTGNYYPQLVALHANSYITPFSVASVIPIKLSNNETYSNVTHNFNRGSGDWRFLLGGTMTNYNNCLSMVDVGVSPNVIVRNVETKGIVRMVIVAQNKICRTVQLWVNLDENFALEVGNRAELETLRQIILTGQGYYYSLQNVGNRYTTAQYPSNPSFIEIVDGGQDLRFQLTADISLSDDTWNPIGTSSHPFRGTFNGASHTVSNFIVVPFNSSEPQCNTGFFGYIEGGTVQDLIIDSVRIRAAIPHQGALCGYNFGGTLNNCLVRNCRIQLQGAGEGIGLVCGTNRYGHISHCQVGTTHSGSLYNNSFSIISGGDKLGGICGHNAFGVIDSCYVDNLSVNTATVANRVGGVVGYNEGGSVVANSINNSDLKNITGSCIGGIAGASDGYSAYCPAVVSNCSLGNTTVYTPNANIVGGVVGSASGEYSSVSGITMSDTVYGDSIVGGIVGLLEDATVDSCWNQSYVRTKSYCVGGIVGMMNGECGVAKCFNTGTVGNSVAVDYVGGIVGMMNGECSVSSSFNSGVVKGRNYVGGLVGRMRDGSYFTDCYNTGIVNGIVLVGGLVGFQKDPTVPSGYGYSAGWVEGASMTGAVCGFTTDTTMLHDLHYDRQLCAYKGVCHIGVQSAEGADVAGVTAHPSSEMTSITFGNGRPWVAGTASMYPRLSALVSSGADRASALALQIGNAYDLAPDTSFTLPSSVGAVWYTSDNIASISENILTAGKRGLMRLSARTAGGINLRMVQLAFGISEARPIEITNSEELGKFRDLIYSEVQFYYDPVGKQFYNLNGAASSHILPQCIIIAPGGAGYHFKLTADVTVSNWTPIGTTGYPFFGHFDGGGHIVNITSIYAGFMRDQRGLFGAMMGRVKNLVVDNTAVRGDNRVGALAGYCIGSVSYCGTTGLAAIEADTAVGGLVGEARHSLFFDCWNGMRVYGQEAVGGIVGRADSTIVMRCFNYGCISGDTAVGGIGGMITGQSLVSSCYNTGAVKGNAAVSAIVGSVQCSVSSVQLPVAGCYNAGYIVGPALQTPNYFNDAQMNPRVDGQSLLTAEIIGDGLRSQLGDIWWSYHAGEYPRLKSLENTPASAVSVKSLALEGKMPANSIVRQFSADTTSGVVWNRYGTGSALRIPNTADSNGVFTIANCGADTLQATLTVGGRTYARLIPVVVMSASDVNIDTIYACVSFTWDSADGQTYTDEGFHLWVAPGAQCGEAQAIDLRFAPVPISVSVSKSDACSDSYWSKYEHNVGSLKATATGGYSGSYTYEWSKIDGTIGNYSFIAGHPDSLHNLTYGDYVITVNDTSTPYCTVRDTVNIDEFSFNCFVTKWGNCVDMDDGWIDLVIRQFEFNRDGSPYTVEYRDSNHAWLETHIIQSLDSIDDSGVPKGFDTIFNLPNGLYYMTITDRLGCYKDKQIKVNDPINPKMTLRAKGCKKVYDGTPVSLNSINVVEYDDNWKVPERAEYYVTSGQWRQLALRIGDSLMVNLANPDTLIKDVDSVRNIILNDWSIKDAETGKDKTCLYHFYPIDSCIVIIPAPLTLTTGSATKEYDGTPLTNNEVNLSGLVAGETVQFSFTGSQTDVGVSDNSCAIVWSGTAKQGNYTLTETFGTLTITPNTQEVVITAGSGSKAYDGTALTNSTFTYDGLPAGFYVEATTSGSQTDLGSCQNVVSSYVIKNSEGEDKTAFFSNVTLVPGTLTVLPISVNLAVGNATWHAISSPMHDGGHTSLGTASVTNLLNAAYDLFRYDEATATWENAKLHSYNLEAARGYIYRRAAAATLSFNGQPYSGNVAIGLTASCPDNALRGFNLVGNPYNHTATIAEPCYTLGTDGAWLAHATGYELAVGEAALVHTNGTRTLTFSEPSAKGSVCTPDIVFTLGGMDHTDVAYAVLGYGESLPKMSHLEAQLPALSIPVDGQRYAIATLDDGCEIFPLAFSAPEGRYTLGTQTSSSATIGYLHLIDKVAGEDIDLLRYPTYTFTVTSGQWPVAGGRFLVKLSPTASIPQEEETFARWNGEAWVIDGDGTLQVYDVLGRQLFFKEVSTSCSIPNSQFPAAGVYVLRLGEKSQKIVIR